MAYRVGTTRGSAFGRTLFLLVNIVYAVALAGVSMMSEPPHIPVLSRTDWLAHGLAYFVQAVLLFPLFREMIPRRSAIAAAAGTAMLFGVVMEVVQLAMPDRFFELQDVFANTAGITLAVLLLAWIGPWVRAKPGDSPS